MNWPRVAVYCCFAVLAHGLFMGFQLAHVCFLLALLVLELTMIEEIIVLALTGKRK